MDDHIRTLIETDQGPPVGSHRAAQAAVKAVQAFEIPSAQGEVRIELQDGGMGISRSSSGETIPPADRQPFSGQERNASPEGRSRWRRG
jgi:hypothetical protein